MIPHYVCSKARLTKVTNGIWFQKWSTSKKGGKQSIYSNDIGGTDYLNVYIIRIPGLCADLSVDPRHDAPGYIAFIRFEKSDNTQISAEQRKFEWYRANVLLPLIELCCVKYYGWVAGTDIPNDLTACCWCDGANIHLNAITSKRLKYVDKTNKIVTCKHSISRTAVEQACSISPIFRLIKAMSKSITTESTPSMGLKLIVQNIFKDLRRDNKLLLSPTKEGGLNNFHSSYPTIITKATITYDIKSGFIYNGMADNASYTTPDMMAILNTCKTKKSYNQQSKQWNRILKSYTRIK